jgi:hypothetical protein
MTAITSKVEEPPKQTAPVELPVLGGPNSDLKITIQNPVVGREFRITATWKGPNPPNRMIIYQTDQSKALPHKAEPSLVDWQQISRPGRPLKPGEWKDEKATEGIKFRYRQEGQSDTKDRYSRYWDCMAPKEAGDEYVSIEVSDHVGMRVYPLTPAYFVVKIQPKT